jgi:hypothetical protein
MGRRWRFWQSGGWGQFKKYLDGIPEEREFVNKIKMDYDRKR